MTQRIIYLNNSFPQPHFVFLTVVRKRPNQADQPSETGYTEENIADCDPSFVRMFFRVSDQGRQTVTDTSSGEEQDDACRVKKTVHTLSPSGNNLLSGSRWDSPVQTGVYQQFVKTCLPITLLLQVKGLVCLAELAIVEE